MDLLFASDKPWVWEAEKEFERLKKENMQILHTATDAPVVAKFDEKNAKSNRREGSDQSI